VDIRREQPGVRGDRSLERVRGVRFAARHR
jgi:hypothetical protein